MTMQFVNTPNAPAAIGPYSQATICGNQIFLSGQLGLVPKTGELAGSDFSSQAKQALENIRQIVLSVGCSLNQIAAVDVYVTDLKNFALFNEIYQSFFEGHKPARAVIQVSGLPKSAVVEIKCIVVK